MNYTLIKQDNNLILCNEEEIKKNNLFTAFGVITQCLMSDSETIYVINGTKLKQSEAKKVIAQTSHIKLSEEVANKIGWIDVEEIAYEYYNSNNYTIAEAFHFMQGFQKAQQLIQKKYSEKDLRKAVEMCKERRYLPHSGNQTEPMYSIDDIIKSLSTNKWKVEVELINEIYYINKIF